jgi:hypothetical protein
MQYVLYRGGYKKLLCTQLSSRSSAWMTESRNVRRLRVRIRYLIVEILVSEWVSEWERESVCVHKKTNFMQ